MPDSTEANGDPRAPDLDATWARCLEILRDKVGTLTYESYLVHVRPLGYADGVVTLGTPSAFISEWLEKRSGNAIRGALEFHLDTDGLQVAYAVAPQDQHAGRDAAQQAMLLTPEPDASAVDEADPAGAKRLPRRAARRVPGIAAVPQFTLETYVVGNSNKLAHAVATSVASDPGSTYNPFYIYGPPGLGKSHLLHAISNRIRSERPDLNVALITGEYFVQHFVSALRAKNTHEFREQYRQVDVLIVDEVDFVVGRPSSQQEFFYTFEALCLAGRQIVLASESAPRDIQQIDERLRTRFFSGLVADIRLPELETRMGILRQICGDLNVTVPFDVLEHIASAIQSNARALGGAIRKLVACSSVMKMPIDSAMVNGVLAEFFIDLPMPARRIRMEDVMRACAGHYGFPVEALTGQSRTKEVALARHVAMYLCRDLVPSANLKAIGEAFGNRDHATVTHACERVAGMQAHDDTLRAEMDAMRRAARQCGAES